MEIPEELRKRAQAAKEKATMGEAAYYQAHKDDPEVWEEEISEPDSL